jgi:hypothetical protein
MMSLTPPRPPRVFISYDFEQRSLREVVVSLADRLRADGIDAHVDMYIPSPAQGWAQWREQQILAAAFVVVVCTASYRRYFEDRWELSGGLQVRWEASFLRQRLHDVPSFRARVLPVYLPNGSKRDVPVVLRSCTPHALPTGYEDMYRRITRQPATVPPTLGIPGWSNPALHSPGPMGSQAAGAVADRSRAPEGGLRPSVLVEAGVSARRPVLKRVMISVFLATVASATAVFLYRYAEQSGNKALDVDACRIRVVDGIDISQGWVVLDSGEIYVVEVVDGVLLKFQCPPEGVRGAVVVNMKEGNFHFWEDAVLVPEEILMLSIPEAKVGVPANFVVPVDEPRSERRRYLRASDGRMREAGNDGKSKAMLEDDLMKLVDGLGDDGASAAEHREPVESKAESSIGDQEPVEGCPPNSTTCSRGSYAVDQQSSEGPSNGDIKKAMGLVKPLAKLCIAKYGGKPREVVKLKLIAEGKTGRIVRAWPQGLHQKGPIGKCVAIEAKKAQLESFPKDQYTFFYPFYGG